MKRYKVMQSPSGKHIAIKQGWSWPGFFFSLVWVLIKKLWHVAAIILVALLVWTWLANRVFTFGNSPDVEIVGFYSTWLLTGLISVLLGIKGNTLRERTCRQRGWDLVRVVDAVNPDAAVALCADSAASKA